MDKQLFKTQTMKTDLRVKKISIDEMLERSEKAYNPSIWNRKVKEYATLEKIQFYVIEPDRVYSYARFYTSYILDGIYFFSEWNGFSVSLTNNGFCKVRIDEEGYVIKTLFKDGEGNEGYAENDNRTRKLFSQQLTPYGIMVSTSI